MHKIYAVALIAVAAAFVSSARPAQADVQTSSTSTGAHDLVSLIDLALAHNLQTPVEDSRIEQAKALYEFAAAQAYPSLKAQALFGGPTPEATTRVPNDPSTLTDPSFLGDLDFGTLGFSFRVNGTAIVPLYTFEKIELGKTAAGQLIKAAKMQKRATQMEVIYNVHRAYWTYQLVRRLEKSLAEGQGILERILKKVEDLLDNDSGQVTENDRLRLRYFLATLTARGVEAKANREIAEKALLLLTGRSQSGTLAIIERDLEDSVPESLPPVDTVVAEVKRDRPELRALRHVVQAQEKFSDLRRASFLPNLFLGGFVNYAYTNNATDQTNPFIADRFNFFEVGVGLGLQLELDVFTKLAQLEQAEAEERLRKKQEILATEAAEFDLRRIYAQLDGRIQRIENLETANRTARGWLTAAALGYDVGVGAADELIDAFLAWAASEAELQTIRYSAVVGFAEMGRATGRLLPK